MLSQHWLGVLNLSVTKATLTSVSAPEPRHTRKALQTSTQNVFRKWSTAPLQLPKENDKQRATFQLLTRTLHLTCRTTPMLQNRGPLESDAVSGHRSNQLQVSQQPLRPQPSLLCRLLRVPGASSTLLALAGTEDDHLGSCPGAGAWWVPQTEGFCAPPPPQPCLAAAKNLLCAVSQPQLTYLKQWAGRRRRCHLPLLRDFNVTA